MIMLATRKGPGGIEFRQLESDSYPCIGVLGNTWHLKLSVDHSTI